MLAKDSKAYCRACDTCQRMGRPSWRDELPFNQVSLHPFQKWATDFIGPIVPSGKKTGALYIITVEEEPAKDCTGAATAKFLFEYVLTSFGFLKVLMSDHGMNFLNETTNELTEEFQVYHLKSMPYHPQANGTIEAFNNTLENALAKV